MKLIVVAAVAILAVVASASSDEELWREFKKNHGKTYRSLREEKLRFNNFQENLRKLETHNARYEKGEVSYYLAINKFSDLSSEEFAAKLDRTIPATKPKNPKYQKTRVVQNFTSAVPESINWVEKKVVADVKDQGECMGGYWAFSAVASIEGQYALKEYLEYFSEQYLLDCSKHNFGCSSGNVHVAFEDVARDGIKLEGDYEEFEGHQDFCHDNGFGTYGIKGYSEVWPDEHSLKTAVGIIGPISVSVAGDLWVSYGGGIFDNVDCTDKKLNHGAAVVGYGSENGTDYWLIKNSWGEDWGEEGYMRLARNKLNLCGIASDATYPII